MSRLTVRNPSTGAILRELDATPVDRIPALLERARAAQAGWAALSPKKRGKALLEMREAILNQLDQLVELICQETGKPRFEALSNEVFPSLELLTHFSRRAPKLLRDQPLPLRLMHHRSSTLNAWPLGVVAVITPWNFPLILPLGDIAQALAAGNAVLFKPSELTPLTGLKIQELFELSGLPTDLVQTLIGGAEVGDALVRAKPDKIFFTGGAETGRKIMKAAADALTPLSLELGGKDALIVLPDANLEYASSAALWGAFSNSGQICSSVERILVHESVQAPFTELLLSKMAKLRQAAPSGSDHDLGAITSEKQKAVYRAHLEDARSRGLRILGGGTFSSDGRLLHPAIVAGEGIEESKVYREETFGPLVAIAPFRTIAEAVAKANDSDYGLNASIIARNLSLAEDVARQLRVGTVMINEVVYTAGLPETPWGGVKASGFGRRHGDAGFLEFVNIRHIHRPKSRIFSFKSLWWFPYGDYQYAAFRNLTEIYRRSFFDRFRGIAHFLSSLVQFLKREKRL